MAVERGCEVLESFGFLGGERGGVDEGEGCEAGVEEGEDCGRGRGWGLGEEGGGSGGGRAEMSGRKELF